MPDEENDFTFFLLYDQFCTYIKLNKYPQKNSHYGHFNKPETLQYLRLNHGWIHRQLPL